MLAETDTHAGNMFGLCDPDIKLLDSDGEENGIDVKKFQRYLWRLRLACLARCAEIAGPAEIIHTHTGDITQGLRFKTELVSTREADQFAIAEANMIPVYNLPNVRTGRLCTGTASHVFYEGTSEIEVARLLRLRYPDKDIKPLAHYLVEFDGTGIRMDVTHHGPGAGIREWTRGNVSRHYLRSVMWQEHKRGRRPADVYLRGHYHTFVWETLREQFGGEMVTSHLIVLPSWCGMTEYSRQATKSQYVVENGLVLFKMHRGQIEIEPMVQEVDVRVQETL